MNISQRLRTCARHTGLDAVIELLNEAADEIDRLQGTQPAEAINLSDQAVQKRLTTQWGYIKATQAEVTDKQIKMLIPRGDAWKYEIGFPEAIKFARAILALRPVQVPMTGWQPIATAPMTGRKVLLAYVNRNGKPRTVMARWLTDDQAAETDADGVGLEGGWYECIDNWGDYTEVAIHEGEPTHWMPLPPPPAHHGITAQAKEGGA